METKHTPQALRLKEFIQFTGMNHTEFGRQCGFKSTRTLQSIYTEGKSPTNKALDKIVSRFPQLNYDWVLMGVGTMINPAFRDNTSQVSNNKSSKSVFQQIQKKLNSHDLNLNQLSIDVDNIIKQTQSNMLIQTQSMALLTNKMELLTTKIEETVKSLDNKYAYWEETTKKVIVEHIELIKSLDATRREYIEKKFESVEKKSNENTTKAIGVLENFVKDFKEYCSKNIEKIINNSKELNRQSVETFKPVLGQLSKNKKR